MIQEKLYKKEMRYISFFKDIILNINLLFKNDRKNTLIILIIFNLMASFIFFKAFYPIFFYALVNIFLFFIFNKIKKLTYFLFIYQIYFLVSIFVIKLDIPYLVGYSDQFSYLLISSYYFNTTYSLFDILFNKIEFEFYYMNLYWTKIIYVLRFISIDNDEVVLFFNFSFYFLVSVFVYKNLQHLFKSDKMRDNFFIFTSFSPPAFFINSLYLKESLIMSTLIILAISLYKNKYIYVFLSAFILFKLRSSFFLLFIIIYMIILSFYIRKKVLKYLFCIFTSIIVVGIFYLAIKNNVNNKLFDYFEDAKNGITIRNETATIIKFIDKDNLLSVKNLIIVPALGILTPAPTRFMKSFTSVALLESFFISIFWWLSLPFFIIFILNCDLVLKKIMLSIFLTVFLASIFSFLSIAAEPFRYRLPIYGIFMIGGFIGYYIYLNSNKRGYYKNKLYLWFFITAVLYVSYIII